MATAEALTPRIAALENEVEQLRAKAEELSEERDRLAVAIQPITADLNGLTAQRKAVASLMSTLSASKGGVQAKLDAVAEAEAQAKDYREQITSIARKLNDYQVLYQAFGLDGIQYMIVKGVVPEITHRANGHSLLNDWRPDGCRHPNGKGAEKHQANRELPRSMD